MATMNVVESLHARYSEGKLTMRQVREEMCICGWFNYLPSEEQVRNVWNRFGLN